MAKIPVLDAVRIIPREADFLDRRSGNRGEVYVDNDVGTLRLYNGEIGGINLLKDDLSNISSAALNKNVNFGTGTVTATQFIGAGIGAVLGDTPPTAAAGTIWFNTSTGKLYIYYNDGTSLQWVQPMTPSVGGGSGGGSGSGTVNSGLAGKLAYYPSAGTTVDDLSSIGWADSTLSITGGINVSAQKNYVRFHWDTLADLNNEANPTTWRGMLAHVHATGRVYVAHASAWVPLANFSDVAVTGLLAGNNVTVSNNNGVYTINAVTGGAGAGTVTTVSVVSANGFTGSVATASSTPAITIATSITGLLKGNGTAISAATSGTDYQAPIGTISGIVKGNGANALIAAVADTDYQSPITLTTTGSSGAATFIGNTLNIPQYSGGGGSVALSSVTEVYTAGLTVDQFYLPAITKLNVTANGVNHYRFDQYGTTDDPTIYAINATTIAFNLAGASGHPFLIQDNTGTNYNTGLVHVSTDGIVSTGSAAQNKASGTLYWKIPDSISGNYRYQCGNHLAMVGIITIKNFATI